MANPYPAIVQDQNGETRIAGKVNFTDAGNQPGATFNGGTITTPLTIATGVDEVALELTAIAGMGEYIAHAATVVGPAEIAVFVDNTNAQIGADGGGGTGNATLYADNLGGVLTAGGPTWVAVVSGATATDRVAIGTGVGTAPFTVDPNGYLFIGTHAAPADAALDAGECALWFDQTNGAAKLMLKGKTANGTVVAAAIALA